jgi:predicted transcriptional regulator
MIPDIGEIKLLRRKLDITQQELAARSGVSQSLIAKIESGKVDPAYSKAVKLMTTLYQAEERSANLSAQKVMQKKVISVSPETKVAKAVEIMKRHGISQLPIIRQEQAVGLVSEGIILDALLEKKGQLVGDIMQEPPPIVSQNVNMKVVSQLLRYYPIVLVSQKGRVKGVITKADMLATL